MTDTFWGAFSLHANNSEQPKTPLDAHLCRACFDLMWSAAAGQYQHQSRKQQKHQTEAAAAATADIDATSALQRFNSLDACPVQWSLIEEERSVRRTPFARDEVSGGQTTTIGASCSSTSSSAPSSVICSACLGAVQHIDSASFELASAVVCSPYKDANEISICCTVPPSLCLWWDCFMGLFAECVFRCEELRMPGKLQGVALIAGSRAMQLQQQQDGAAGAEGLYYWRGNLKEDQIGGGLRGAIVGDIKTFGVQCLPAPLTVPMRHDDSDEQATATTTAGAVVAAATTKWKFSTQGQGQGIVCQALWHNSLVWAPATMVSGAQLAAYVMSGNLGGGSGCLAPASSSTSSRFKVDPSLLQHDASDLQWTRIAREIAPIVACASASPATVITRCSVAVHHEPLFLYGRYRKFSRTMSQSPWFASGGVRIGRQLSLQEEISNQLLHIFFPGCDVDALNKEAALYDARLLVPTWQKKAVANNNSSNGENDEPKSHHQQQQQQQQQPQRSGPPAGVQVRKQEVQKARREAAQEAVSGVGNNSNGSGGGSEKMMETPQRRERDEEEIEQAKEGGFGFVSAHVRPFFDNVRGFCLYRFHAGGREDVDVRMLGNGRPFVVEVISPHRQFFSNAELQELSRAISETSDSVEVDSLQVVPRTIMMDLQKDAEAKRKAYRCVCYSQRPLRRDDPVFARIQAQLPITLQQRTPTRVLHRRSSMTREKKIYSVEMELLNEHWMVVDLVTQAGTYVKEFCHGDMGRTVPNLATLLESDFTDIIQLDVKMLFSSLNGNNDDDAAAAAGEEDDEDDDADDE